MKIYAEWHHNGKFDNGFFSTWDDYHRFFFNPEIKVMKVRSGINI